jgi:hypothetical protein
MIVGGMNLRLYAAAQDDATLLMQICLDFDNITTLKLAAKFLEDGCKLDEAVRKEAVYAINYI